MRTLFFSLLLVSCFILPLRHINAQEPGKVEFDILTLLDKNVNSPEFKEVIKKLKNSKFKKKNDKNGDKLYGVRFKYYPNKKNKYSYKSIYFRCQNNVVNEIYSNVRSWVNPTVNLKDGMLSPYLDSLKYYSFNSSYDYKIIDEGYFYFTDRNDFAVKSMSAISAEGYEEKLKEQLKAPSSKERAIEVAKRKQLVIRKISNKIVSKCITQNCDKPGKQIVIVEISDGVRYEGLFIDGVAQGKADYIIERDVISFWIKTSFKDGLANGETKIQMYHKEDKTIELQIDTKLKDGCLGGYATLSSKKHHLKGNWKKSYDIDYSQYELKDGLGVGEFELDFKVLNDEYNIQTSGYLFPFCLTSTPVTNYPTSWFTVNYNGSANNYKHLDSKFKKGQPIKSGLYSPLPCYTFKKKE